MSGAVAAAAALAVAVSGPQAPELSAAQLAGQRVVFAYAGVRVPDALVRRVRRGEAAGVILFARNVPSRDALRRELRRLQRIPRPPGLRAPLLVMVDQEGGPVRRLPGAPRRAAAELRDRRSARAAGRAAGRNLRGAGANVDLAPVADVARPGSAIERERRSFGRDAGRVARLAVAFALGLRDTRAAATVKHFPGFGAAPVNTDFAPVRIGASRGELRRVDMRPFAAAIAAGVPLVMVSTVVYPALDPRRPAALSRRIATDELRGRLGFEGVSIADSLGTPAVARFGDGGRVAVAAANAGCDIVLFGGGYLAGARAANGLARAIRSGELDRAEAERSVERVLALRATLP
jgi:beta-N-acetylhexosaminidase